MIVIASNEQDISTNKVIDWLAYKHEIPYQRINGLDWFNRRSKTSFRFNNGTTKADFKDSGNEFNLEDLTAIWFRKDTYAVFTKDLGRGSDVNEQVNLHLKEEHYYAKEGIYELLTKQCANTIGHRIINEPQKINTLLIAKSIGIDIPDTLVTNRKADLLNFYKENNGAITKPIKESRRISDGNSAATMYVANVKKEDLEEVPDHFMVSLFQERLDIVFDIRVFYLDGKFYPIAIFTPKGKDRIDVRDTSSKDVAFRETKYKLSEELESKLTKLMDQLGLVSGSLDLIHTKDGRTVFLEVNPWGQYGNVARSGNYFINEKIAEYLVYGSQRS